MKSSLHHCLVSVYFITNYLTLVTTLPTNPLVRSGNSTTNQTRPDPNTTSSPANVTTVPAATMAPARPILPDPTCPDPVDITPDYGYGIQQPNPDVPRATPGSIFAFFCRQYFVLVPTTPFRECQDDGSWSGTDHRCIANSTARCSDPELPEHSRPRNPMKEFPIFAVLQMECEEGWVGRGNLTVQCNHLKKWQIDFSCVPGCPVKELPEHSTFSPLHPYSDIAINETVPMVCESGYHLLGVPEVSCNSTGHVIKPQFGCCPDQDTYDAMRSVYHRNPEYFYGPLLMVMALVNLALVIKIFKRKKLENKIVSTDMIKVKPVKGIELQNKSDFRLSKRPKDTVAAHLQVKTVKNPAAAHADEFSPYRKISREDTF